MGTILTPIILYAQPSGESDGTPTNTSGESDGTPTNTSGGSDSTPTNTSGGSDGTPTNTSGESDGTPVPWWKPKYINDEEKKVAYIYSVFHFLMLISVLYLMMHLTNWAQ